MQRIIIITLFLIFTSCKEKIIPPTTAEAFKAIEESGKKSLFDTSWGYLPKVIYKGTRGGSVTILRDNEESIKNEKLIREALSYGFIVIDRREEQTGNFFFSQEEIKMWDYIIPTGENSQYFKESSENPNYWKIALAISQNHRFVNYNFKKGKNSYKPDAVYMFYDVDRVYTPLNEIFKLKLRDMTNESKYFYAFEKDSLTKKWLVVNYGTTSLDNLEPND